MTVTLGECLELAEQRFGEADRAGLPGAYLQPVIVFQVRRLVGTIGRYLDAAEAAFRAVSDDTDGWPEPAAQMSTTLRAAGTFLDAALLPSGTVGASPDPAARRYAGVVDALVTGQDLLRTHTGPGQRLALEARSEHARLLASGPVVTALAEETAAWASRAARIVNRVAENRGQAGHLSVLDLLAARNKLASVASVDLDPDESLSVSDRRHVLRSIPTVVVPARSAPVPGGGEDDVGLCAGIGVSARRLRAAAFTASQELGGSPRLSGRAWRKEATAAWLICDLSEKLLRTLAAPGTSAAAAGLAAGRLNDAAESFATARTAWRHTAWMWQHASTDTITPTSGSGTEAADIAVRLGRLLTGNPGWKPVIKDAEKTVPRDGAALAPDREALANVLGAVHEAADAVTAMAGGSMSALTAAQGSRRLYLQVAALGEENARYAYVPAPGDRIHLLRNGGYLCEDATWHAAARMDQIARQAGTRTQTLALIRAALPGGGRTMDLEPGFEADLDAFAIRLESFTRLKGNKGQDRSRIDPQAVVRAYRDDGLGLKVCGERFSVSEATIRSILTAHGVQPRSTWTPRRASTPEESAPAPPPDPTEPDPGADSSLYHRLHHLGVEDPALLGRAVSIDRATADVLSQVGGDRLYDVRPARKRSAPDIAAADGPRTADAAVQSAKSMTSPASDSTVTNSKTKSSRPGPRR